MKINRILLVTLSILSCLVHFSSVLSAQSFVKIVESNEDGDSIILSSEDKIVEPNSKIKLVFDKNQLKLRLSNYTMGSEFTTQLIKLRAVLEDEKLAMDSLKRAIFLFTENEPASVWQKPLTRVGVYARTILREDREARDIFNSLAAGQEPDVINQYGYLFRTAEIMISRLQEKIVLEAKANGVYLQLGAWLNAGSTSAPIHIPGFDDYTAEPASRVERFRVVLDAEQQKQLTAITDLAKDANSNGLSSIARRYAGEAGKGIGNKLTTLPSFDIGKKTLVDLETMLKQDQLQIAAIKSTLTETLDKLENYYTNTEILIKKYNGTSTYADANSMLQNVNTDIGQLVTDTKALQVSLTGTVQKFRSMTIAGTLSTQYNQLISTITKLETQLRTDLTSLEQIPILFRQFVYGEDVANKTLAFTEKVKKLSFDDMLETAVIDLVTSGTRDIGNTLYIKMDVGKPGKSNVNLYEKTLSLYYCSIYARTTVGFLFVSPAPVFKRTEENALFRYTPSYSVLLKGFSRSRKNIKYHTLFDPGLGLNFSALDFDGNGAMEFGIGAVGALFKDFIQLGYGVNTFNGLGFAFFGFKLPVGSFSIH